MPGRPEAFHLLGHAYPLWMTCAATVSTDSCSCLYRQPFLDTQIFPSPVSPSAGAKPWDSAKSQQTAVVRRGGRRRRRQPHGGITGEKLHPLQKQLTKGAGGPSEDERVNPCRPASPQPLWQRLEASLQRQRRSGGHSGSAVAATPPRSCGD